MANKKLYRDDVMQMLFADSDSEGEYLPFGNDDRSSNDRDSPGTSLQLVPPRKARVFTKQVKQVIILTLCPTGMGVAGVNVVIVSIGELLLTERHWLHGADDRPDCIVCSDRSRSKGSQCRVGLCAVPYNERYHTLKNYKLCHLDT